MKIAEMPMVERPREKLLRWGRESLSSAELLALIVGNGTKGRSAMNVAMDILSQNRQGLVFLAECTPEELMTIDGIGSAKASEILAAVELGRRIAMVPREGRDVITNAKDVADLMMERMRYYKKEYFVCVLLNVKGEVIEEVNVSIGDLSSSTTHPREAFVEAVRRSAGSVIFLHNHPSGDPHPSDADILTTRRLIDVGELLGIPVIDHIIIGDGVYYSMKGEGVI